MADTPQHSSIGASSYYRWKHCPGSARLAEKVEKTTTVYAAEGHEAHDLGYQILMARKHKTPMPDTFGVDDETLDHVMVFVDHMTSIQRPGCIQLYEHRFHLKEIHPLCYGTCDGITYYPDTQLLVISDYKHGAGLFVDVVKNEQLLYYALGAVLTLKRAVKKIRIEIIQPRISYAEAIRPWELDIFDIWEFADQLKADAMATQAPDAPLCAGEWCAMCPVAPTCPVLRLKMKVFLTQEQKHKGLDDINTVAEELEWLHVLEAAFRRKREFAYAMAEKGVKVPGWKLVEKIGRRQYKDASLAEDAFFLRGLKEETIYTKPKAPELLSPAQIEALPLKETGFRSKKELKAFVKTLTFTQSSGHKLVPESDDGEEVKIVTANTVFSAIRPKIAELT